MEPWRAAALKLSDLTRQKRMQANYVQRLRLTFSKSGPARYIGHLDLTRTLERALRRARIPLAYTQGFNRRPRMSLAAALPLGYTSACELADIWLAEAMPPQQARAQMMANMAPGIEVHKVVEAPLSQPALQTLTTAAEYTATPGAVLDQETLQARVAALLTAVTHLHTPQPRGKSQAQPYDLRPLIHTLRLETAVAGGLQIHMRLALLPSQSGRPDEVLHALELDPLAAYVHRTRIVLADEG
jgi:radical SAM-linked protein